MNNNEIIWNEAYRQPMMSCIYKIFASLNNQLPNHPYTTSQNNKFSHDNMRRQPIRNSITNHLRHDIKE